MKQTGHCIAEKRFYSIIGVTVEGNSMRVGGYYEYSRYDGCTSPNLEATDEDKKEIDTVNFVLGDKVTAPYHINISLLVKKRKFCGEPCCKPEVTDSIIRRSFDNTYELDKFAESMEKFREDVKNLYKNDNALGFPLGTVRAFYDYALNGFKNNSYSLSLQDKLLAQVKAESIKDDPYIKISCIPASTNPCAPCVEPSLIVSYDQQNFRNNSQISIITQDSTSWDSIVTRPSE